MRSLLLFPVPCVMKRAWKISSDAQRRSEKWTPLHSDSLPIADVGGQVLAHRHGIGELAGPEPSHLAVVAQTTLRAARRRSPQATYSPPRPPRRGSIPHRAPSRDPSRGHHVHSQTARGVVIGAAAAGSAGARARCDEGQSEEQSPQTDDAWHAATSRNGNVQEGWDTVGHLTRSA